MTCDQGFNTNRSVQIGNHVTGSSIQTGDSNIALVQTSLPNAETVDIAVELAILKTILTHLDSPDQRKIGNALEDAEEELKKSEPDKDEIGQALDRALAYAEKANRFTEAVDKLRPHVENIAGWLGKHWYKLLAVVGLTI